MLLSSLIGVVIGMRLIWILKRPTFAVSYRKLVGKCFALSFFLVNLQLCSCLLKWSPFAFWLYKPKRACIGTLFISEFKFMRNLVSNILFRGYQFGSIIPEVCVIIILFWMYSSLHSFHKFYAHWVCSYLIYKEVSNVCCLKIVVMVCNSS